MKSEWSEVEKVVLESMKNKTMNIASDDRLAKLFLLLIENPITCTNIKTGECYWFDNSTTLYHKIEINELAGDVTDFLSRYITPFLVKVEHEIMRCKSEEKKNKLGIIRDMYKNIVKKVESTTESNNIAKAVCRHTYDSEFLKMLDTNRDTVNFINGYVNLVDGKFHHRKATRDYYTQCLPYRYEKECDSEVKTHIEGIIKLILNSDDDSVVSYLNYLGYCMTGHTNYQRSLWSIGISASNGKSTLFDAFSSMFSIYSHKLNSKVFDIGFKNQHKQLTDLKGKRFAYIEELGLSKLDRQLLKDFIDGRKIGGNEVLYATTEEIILYCKLACASNGAPKFGTDEGMRRRGVLFKHKNRFVVNPINKDPEHPTQFKIDRTLVMKFERDDYKLALFHILLPHAMNYYKNGLEKDEKLINNWEKLCIENDTMKLYTESYYTKTDDSKDIIAKDIFLLNYQKYTGNNKANWTYIIDDIKRIGLKYDRNPVIKDPKTGKTYRGGIRGIVKRQVTKEDEVCECEEFDSTEEDKPVKKPSKKQSRAISDELDFDDLITI